jgi:hypothetical protein
VITTRALPRITSTKAEGLVETQVAGPTTEQDADVFYDNCSAVRAAGKDPLYRGDPGYRSKLDRDNDGIACE